MVAPGGPVAYYGRANSSAHAAHFRTEYMNDLIDNVSRILATPMPRRKAMKLFGGVFAAAVVALSLAVGYAVVTHGGDAANDSTLSFAALGLTAIAASFLLRAGGDAPGGRAVEVAVLLFPAYLLFQLVPLPLGILRVVSPT